MRCIYALFVAVLVTAETHVNVNIDELLSDKNQFHEFVTCFLNKAPCSEIAAIFKKDVPAAVLHGCENCTPEQKHIVNAFIISFKKEPQQYQAFKEVYDPDNKYLDKLEAAVNGF